MVQAANDAELPSDAEFRAAFVSYIEWGSRIAVENSQAGTVPPLNMPVTTHADTILRRLREGTMPCDGAWPTEQIEVFQRWVETGRAP